MKKYIILFAISVLILSCSKEITTPNSGIFRGTFEMTGLNGGGFETGQCTIALYEDSQSYVLSADTTTSLPYNCSGKYIITNATSMTFITKTIPVLNSDPHIILDSNYTYLFDDTKFELSKVIDTIKYEFNFFRY